MPKVFCAWMTACLVISSTVTAQTSIDSLKTELNTLKIRLDKMNQEKTAQEKKNALQDLLDKAKNMGNEKNETPAAEIKFHSGLRQQSALNPNISLGGDFYFAKGTSESELNRNPSETSWGTGKLALRELELGLESALDPFSRAKAFIAISKEGVEVEEGYIEWLNCPLSMNLKMGQFKTRFGKLNRYHLHALPQFELPLVLSNFFGNEGLGGFGLAGNFLMPQLWAHVNELDIEWFSGGVDQSYTSEGKHNIIVVSHFKNYFDLNRSSYLEIGFSGASGKNDAREMYQTLIGGIDITCKWQPPGRAKYRGVEWRTELMAGKRETPDETINAWGGFTSLQIRLNARTLFSGRLDYTQLPQNADLNEKGGALALDYWQSEFIFLRFQYTRISRNFNENDNRFILQTCWAMGPHKHEAY